MPLMGVADFDDAVLRSHEWLSEFIKGDVEPAKRMFSHREDVSLAGPQATAHRGSVPIAHGWGRGSETFDSAIRYFRDGQVSAFESVAAYAMGELGITVEIESFNAKVGARPDPAPVSLRVTTIFRKEEGGWKVVHRHADPITSVPAPESVAQDWPPLPPTPG